MNRDKLPDCFATRGLQLSYGDSPRKCLACEVSDECHKMTLPATLMNINDSLNLIVQNGLCDGSLKGYEELEEADKKRSHRPS